MDYYSYELACAQRVGLEKGLMIALLLMLAVFLLTLLAKYLILKSRVEDLEERLSTIEYRQRLKRDLKMLTKKGDMDGRKCEEREERCV